MSTHNKYFLPDPRDLPQLCTRDGRAIPFPQLIAIDPDNIAAELETHAAWLATIGYAHAEAEAHAGACERAVKRRYAQLWFEYTQSLTEAKVKATLDAVKASITMDEGYQALEETAAEAAKKSAVLKAALKAYSDRRDMLVNLGAEQRLERVRMVQHVD